MRDRRIRIATDVLGKTIVCLTAGGDACGNSTMGNPVLSAAGARRAASEPDRYLVWVTEVEASRFQEPGWVRLEPPRDGAVLFVHRQRELGAARARAIL
jgi:hypothetical protein